MKKIENEDGRKTRSIVRFGPVLAGIAIGLILFYCFSKEDCNKEKPVVAEKSPCVVDTKFWFPSIGAIVENEAMMALKGEHDTVFVKFNSIDNERFQKTTRLATAQQNGQKIEFQIDLLKSDTSDCAFYIQDFRIADKPLIAETLPKPIPNPAKIEVPGTDKPKSVKPKDDQETETPKVVEEPKAVTGNAKPYTLTDGTIVLKGKNVTGVDTTVIAFFDKLETSIKAGEKYKSIKVNSFEKYFKSDFGSK